MTIFTLIFLLLTKHLVVDFFLQPPYMFLNKGNLRHPGGYVHSGLHALVTGIIFLFFFAGDWRVIDVITIPELRYGLSLLIGAIMLFEFIAHYLIDFTKVNVCTKFKWKPESSWQYWFAMGIDQYLHSLTYFGIFYAIQQLVQGS